MSGWLRLRGPERWYHANCGGQWDDAYEEWPQGNLSGSSGAAEYVAFGDDYVLEWGEGFWWAGGNDPSVLRLSRYTPEDDPEVLDTVQPVPATSGVTQYAGDADRSFERIHMQPIEGQDRVLCLGELPDDTGTRRLRAFVVEVQSGQLVVGDHIELDTSSRPFWVDHAGKGGFSYWADDFVLVQWLTTTGPAIWAGAVIHRQVLEIEADLSLSLRGTEHLTFSNVAGKNFYITPGMRVGDKWVWFLDDHTTTVDLLVMDRDGDDVSIARQATSLTATDSVGYHWNWDSPGTARDDPDAFWVATSRVAEYGDTNADPPPTPELEGWDYEQVFAGRVALSGGAVSLDFDMAYEMQWPLLSYFTFSKQLAKWANGSLVLLFFGFDNSGETYDGIEGLHRLVLRPDGEGGFDTSHCYETANFPRVSTGEPARVFSGWYISVTPTWAIVSGEVYNATYDAQFIAEGDDPDLPETYKWVSALGPGHLHAKGPTGWWAATCPDDDEGRPLHQKQPDGSWCRVGCMLPPSEIT